MTSRTAMIPWVVALATVPGCVPSHVVGPLRHERDEREELVKRARSSGASMEVLNAVVPPLTPEEEQQVEEETDSCRASYLWKNGLTWTGGALVGIAAASTIAGALATGTSDTTGKIAFGISAGTLAALGTIFQVIAGVIQVDFADRGCVVR
jgi:hypothetical protein